MNTLKLFAVLAIAVGSVALVLGTGAFSAVDADRFSDVGVADDQSGLLGLTIGGGTIDPGEQVTLVTIENQFGTQLDSVDATVLDSGPFTNVVIQSTPGSLAQGGTGDITATIAGPPGTSGTIDLNIVASGDGGSVDLTREVYVDVESPQPTVCTIGNDDRIGERSFFAEDEIFHCKIDIDTDKQYEVGFENSTATAGFELSAKLLKAMEFEDSEIGAATDIQISQNANGDMSFEATTFDGDFTIGVQQVAQAVTLEDVTIDGRFDLSTRNQNGDVSISESDIDGVGMTFDGPVSGDIGTESNQIGGKYEITARDNVNGGITVEGTSVGGDLLITLDKNMNGDVTIESVDVGGDVTVVVDGRLNGGIEISDSEIDGDLTVDADSAELEGNSVGGTVTRP